MIEDYFPYDSFRKGQREVISSIIEAYESDYENIIVDAPTGFGKSAVVRTVNSILFDNVDGYKSYILTATKNLQNQYFKECKDDETVDYAVMMGRSNYVCHMTSSDCARGLCMSVPKSSDFRCMYKMHRGEPCDNGGCNYYVAKCTNSVADTSIMNYNVLMSDMIHAQHFYPRTIMFCDEAHNIESKIMNEVSLSFPERKISKLFDYEFDKDDYNNTDIESWIGILYNLLERCHETIRKTQSIYSNMDVQTVQEIHSFTNQLEWKLKEIQHSDVEWIVCPNWRGRIIEIKPLSIQRYSYSHLLDNARHHVFLSGSFIDHNQWMNDIGLDETLTAYIRAESSFDMKSNNPIIKRWVGNMSMKTKDKTLPKMAETIESIMNRHPDECGIIHCHSKDNANYILSNVNSARMITYTPMNKEEQLEKFEQSSNLVMVAYSLEEGVDLPYDGVRFQVFMKTPYPSLADNQIRARMNADKRWYEVNTARKIIQAWGRGMRAEDDYCINYMLDTGFNAIIKKDFMPHEFVEALCYDS